MVTIVTTIVVIIIVAVIIMIMLQYFQHSMTSSFLFLLYIDILQGYIESS